MKLFDFAEAVHRGVFLKDTELPPNFGEYGEGTEIDEEGYSSYPWEGSKKPSWEQIQKWHFENQVERAMVPSVLWEQAEVDFAKERLIRKLNNEGTGVILPSHSGAANLYRIQGQSDPINVILRRTQGGTMSITTTAKLGEVLDSISNNKNAVENAHNTIMADHDSSLLTARNRALTKAVRMRAAQKVREIRENYEKLLGQAVSS